MTLHTGATLTLGRLRYSAQICDVGVELALLPGVGRARVLLAGGVQLEAAPGDAATLDLDGGDGGSTVLTGTVEEVARGTTRTGGVEVTLVDAGAALGRSRPAETFDGLPSAQVIARLAHGAGVRTGPVVAPGQTAAFVGHPHRTRGEHIAGEAARSAAIALVDAQGRLVVGPWPSGPPSAALRADRELLALRTWRVAASPEVVRVGAGGAGAALAPDAWVPSTETLVGSAGADPGLQRVDHELRAAADVRLADRGERQRRDAAGARMRATCWLQPARRPGDVVEIQGSDDPGAEGPWLLTAVRHRLGPAHGLTVLHGIRAGAAGPGDGLLGALAGAAGVAP